jgi:NADH:ubiquinone reductase (H+-translocating)
MAGILVVGGGFAGVWSAAGAARLRRECGVAEAELPITLVSSGDDMVIRPRLHEAGPERMRVPLDRVLGPVGVRRVAATVTDIDVASRQVAVVQRDGSTGTLAYDRLVLAAGSRLVDPRGVDGAEHLFNVDTLPAAADLDAHLRLLPERRATAGQFTAVVVGAGFTGLEVATELVGRLRAVAEPVKAVDEVRVVLVERTDVIGPDLGAGPRPQILRALDELGVEQRLETTVTGVAPDHVTLSDGSAIPAATAVWAAGMRASRLTACIPGQRDELGRLRVDAQLRVVGVPFAYAAGDTAAAQLSEGRYVVQSCQHAVPQGKFAGHNVAAGLLGHPEIPFGLTRYATCLDLGAAGAVFTTGWERSVQLDRDAGKDMKRRINTEWIYPPVDDPDTLLQMAGPHGEWPPAVSRLRMLATGV